MDPKAKGRLVASPYKSHQEEFWAQNYQDLFRLELGKSNANLEQVVIAGAHAATISYETVKLKVGGGWYTPDFTHVMLDGTVIFVEIKGSKFQPSYRSARAKLVGAAEAFRWAYFAEVIIKETKVGFSAEFEWIGGRPVEEEK